MTYIDEVTAVGQTLLRAIGAGLGLGPDYFLERYTRDPTVLFRIFNYPPATVAADENELGVGEHTDYGLLTLLQQDEVGGLEIWHRDRWLPAPPVPDSSSAISATCSSGSLPGVTVGAASRAQCVDAGSISMPLFLDPSFDAELAPITPLAPDPSAVGRRRGGRRWDGTDLAAVSGTYGDYLLEGLEGVPGT